MNNELKAKEITSYFMDVLNADDITTEQDFKEYCDEVLFMLEND